MISKEMMMLPSDKKENLGSLQDKIKTLQGLKEAGNSYIENLNNYLPTASYAFKFRAEGIIDRVNNMIKYIDMEIGKLEKADNTIIPRANNQEQNQNLNFKNQILQSRDKSSKVNIDEPSPRGPKKN